MRVAYKVTTSPALYDVAGTISGIVEPGQYEEVQVVLLVSSPQVNDEKAMKYKFQV